LLVGPVVVPVLTDQPYVLRAGPTGEERT
jgi:hypothetical protein